VPWTAALLAAMPAPVVGAALFFTSAFVLTSGLQMITARMLDARKTLVIGFSFAMAVVADLYQPALAAVPIWLQPIVGNALVLSTVCAVVLNLAMRIGVRQTVMLVENEGMPSAMQVEKFLAANGAHWAARRDIVDKAIFGTVQVLEVLGARPGKVSIEASFDEYSLDIRIASPGPPLAIPEQRPTPRDIMVREDGELLLAGYLLKRNANRIHSREIAGRSEVHLHYDH